MQGTQSFGSQKYGTQGQVRWRNEGDNTGGCHKVVLSPSRSKNKGHLSSHLLFMAINRATLGMPSIQISLLMAIKTQSKISHIVGKPSPLLPALV